VLRQYQHTDPPHLWVKLLAGSIAIHVLAVLPVTGVMVITHSTPPAQKTIAVDTVVLAAGRSVPIESARKAAPPPQHQTQAGNQSPATRTTIDPPGKSTSKPTPKSAPNSSGRSIAPSTTGQSSSAQPPESPASSGTETPTSRSPEPSPDPTNNSPTPSAETEVVPADSGTASPTPTDSPPPTTEIEGGGSPNAPTPNAPPNAPTPPASATPGESPSGEVSGGSNSGEQGVQATILRSQTVSLGGTDEPEQVPALQTSQGSPISLSFSPKAQQCQGQLTVRVGVDEKTGSGTMLAVSFNPTPLTDSLDASHPCYELAKEAIAGLRFTPALKDNAPVYGLLDVYIQVGNPNVG
jgi:hypothetical protein